MMIKKIPRRILQVKNRQIRRHIKKVQIKEVENNKE